MTFLQDRLASCVCDTPYFDDVNISEHKLEAITVSLGMGLFLCHTLTITYMLYVIIQITDLQI